MTLAGFLALTFAISLAGFACIVAIPGARSPESAVGLPFWLVMVWGPSLAAISLAWRDGTLPALLGRAVMVSTVPLAVWALILAPLLILLALRPVAEGAPEPAGAGMLLAMVGFNLVLGPLGEELGWRGVMQTDLAGRHGWLAAALMVGAVWAVWHLPLWAIDSPHAQIPMLLFLAHVMLYAVIIGAAQEMSGGSVLPAILLHLALNVAANAALFAGFREPEAWFSASLVPYALLAGLAGLLATLRDGSAAP